MWVIHLLLINLDSLAVPGNGRLIILGDAIESHGIGLHDGLVDRWNGQKCLAWNIGRRRQHTWVERFNESDWLAVSKAAHWRVLLKFPPSRIHTTHTHSSHIGTFSFYTSASNVVIIIIIVGSLARVRLIVVNTH